METPDGSRTFRVGYRPNAYLDELLLERWLGSEEIGERWIANVRKNNYDLTESISVPTPYRFKATRDLAPIRSIEGALYLLEIAGTPREPFVIATYLIRHPYSVKSMRDFVGKELTEKIVEIIEGKGYLKDATYGLEWTDKLRKELGLPQGDYSKYTGFVIGEPEGEIAALTDLRTKLEVAGILCNVSHRPSDDYAQRAALDGDIHWLYHALDLALRGQ
jgi:hypothetical protein